MSVILITANFKFRNRSTCSKDPMKRAGKVCGDSQDLKSPGYILDLNFTVHLTLELFTVMLKSAAIIPQSIVSKQQV